MGAKCVVVGYGPRSTNYEDQQPRGMKVKKHLINATALGSLIGILGLAMVAIAPAHAGGNCDREDVSLDGDLGGGPFAVPARLGAAPGPNIGLSEKSCADNKRDARRSASVVGAMDTFGSQPGLNLTLGYANIGLEDDVNAAAGVVHYRHDFANPGVFHSITGKAGFGADTTGDELGASVGLTLSFGTF